jgi:hypothetical protein
MPFAREAEVVLAMWRDVERSLAATPPRSAEARRLQDEIELLRQEYQRLTDLAREHHRVEPPPLPQLS